MKLMALDGNSLVNRAFYGLKPLTNSSGLNTNAVYGFLNILMKLLSDEAPDALAVCFDLREPTFRHLEYDGYKAQRKGMPDELAEQLAPLKEVLDAMNIRRYELSGFEADDLIGTVARVCSEGGHECVVVTGDRDALQLIGGGVTVKLITTQMGRTVSRDYGRDEFFEEYGFEPERIIDYKALMGDASDNIPGVKGIGKKTAQELIVGHGSVDNIYKSIETAAIKPAVREKLISGRESAFMSLRLATIDKNVPLDFSPGDARLKKYDNDRLFSILKELEFKTYILKLGLRAPGASMPPGARFEKPRDMPDPKEVSSGAEADMLLARCMAEGAAYFCPSSLCAAAVSLPDGVFILCEGTGYDYQGFLRAFFSGDVKKTGSDVKSLMARLLDEGIAFGGFSFDVSLAAWALDAAHGDYSVERLARDFLSLELPPQKVIEADGAFSPLSGGEAALALARYAFAARRLEEAFRPELFEKGLSGLYFDLELPLSEALAEMQHTGFLVDRGRLSEFSQELGARISFLEGEIYRLAGGEFNINSPKQLGEVLFERLGLPPVKKTKSGFSTGAEVLERLVLQHEIVPLILEYRTHAKLRSTYADGLIKVIAPDGRIHSSFQMTSTSTGRLSSTEPNLQNIPIRQELGAEIRKMFVAPEGFLLVDADYSQIELRVLAHIADDKAMIEAFRSGSDIHAITASQVFGVSPESVTPELRRRAKAVNFGIVYGIGDFSLAQDIGVSRAEAKAYIDAYLEHYSGIRAYMHDIVEAAKRDGFVTTIMGRRRYLPELGARNFSVRSFGERAAMNTPIQGSAADIIKLAMLRVRSRLLSEGLLSRLVLQVHDELIVEAPEGEADAAARILTSEMESVMALKVPLVAEASTGKTWAETK